MAFNRTPQGFVLAAKPSAPEKLAKTQPAENHPVIRHVFSAVLAGLIATGSPLAQHLASLKNQGQCSGCTAHAATTCTETRNGFAQCEPSGPLSQKYFYDCTREWERGQTTPAGQPLPPLEDNGAELADVVAAAAVFGAAPFAGPSPDGRNSDLWTAADVAGVPNAPPANVNLEADVEQLEGASNDPLSGAYTIDLTASDAVTKAVAALTAGFPLYCGFFCDTAFMNLQAFQIAQVPNQQDPNGGGHAVSIVDFRPSKTVPGTYEFLLRNSWGNWAGGNSAGDGMVWVSQAFFLAMWECWIWDEKLSIGRKAAA